MLSLKLHQEARLYKNDRDYVTIRKIKINELNFPLRSREKEKEREIDRLISYLDTRMKERERRRRRRERKVKIRKLIF